MSIESTYCPNCQYRLGVSENIKTVGCPNCYKEFKVSVNAGYYTLAYINAETQTASSNITSAEIPAPENQKLSDDEYLKKLTSTDDFFAPAKEIAAEEKIQETKDWDKKNYSKKEKQKQSQQKYLDQKAVQTTSSGGSFFKFLIVSVFIGFMFFSILKKNSSIIFPTTPKYGTKITLKMVNIDKSQNITFSDVEKNLERRLKIILKNEGIKIEPFIDINLLTDSDNSPNKVNILLQDLFLSPSQIQSVKNKLLQKTEVYFKDEKKNTFLNSKNIKYADVRHYEDSGEPALEIVLDDIGKEKLAEFTKANVNKSMGIYFNDKLFLNPNITEPILKGKIWITNKYTNEKAQKLADDINLNLLPFDLAFENIELISKETETK